MRSLRQIRRRIRTVANIHDVTRAMEMVSASRYKRADTRLLSARPYMDKLEELAARLVNFSKYKHPFIQGRTVKKAGLIVVTSARGLCGAYNTNLFKAAHEFLERPREYKPELILIGKKGELHFKRRPYDIISEYSNTGLKFDIESARSLSDDLSEFFIAGRLDEINILYTHFTSAANFKPRIVRFLPIEVKAPEECTEYIYEPDERRVLDEILPVYLAYKLYSILLSGITSEYASRMISMKAATDNADEMLDSLTLMRNKVRQAGITREIAEITSGAEALR